MHIPHRSRESPCRCPPGSRGRRRPRGISARRSCALVRELLTKPRKLADGGVSSRHWLPCRVGSAGCKARRAPSARGQLPGETQGKCQGETQEATSLHAAAAGEGNARDSSPARVEVEGATRDHLLVGARKEPPGYCSGPPNFSVMDFGRQMHRTIGSMRLAMKPPRVSRETKHSGLSLKQIPRGGMCRP